MTLELIVLCRFWLLELRYDDKSISTANDVTGLRDSWRASGPVRRGLDWRAVRF